jgi:hypothetical protein
MTEEIKTLTITRGQIKSRITRFSTFLRTTQFNNAINIQQLRLRISKLELAFEDFDAVQSQLELVDPAELESNNRK